MNKTNLILSVVLLLTSVSTQAALYKGQRVYSKVCMKCHTGGESFVADKTQFEWAMYMDNSGENLASTHLESEKFKAEESIKSIKNILKVKNLEKE